MRHYKTLTWSDRLNIAAWRKVGIPIKKIAELLGVHYSTIYRELKRGQYEHLNSDYTREMRYSPDISEKKKQDFLRAKGAGLKIGNDMAYAEYIEYMIREHKYSPGAVLGEIKRKGLEFSTTVTKPTLYRYIEQGVFLTITNENLPVKRNKRDTKYRTVKAKKAQRGTSIEKRPPEISARISFGHWEMDCVEGAKGTKGTLLVLTERLTRYEIIRKMKDKTADSVVKALNSIEREYGSALFRVLFQTITVDNGTEFSDVVGIEMSMRGKKARTKTYYCHPYSSWERGSNENQNKMVRRHYPKGCNFDPVTPAEIRKLEKWINNYPRQIFDWYSSADLFQAHIDRLLTA